MQLIKTSNFDLEDFFGRPVEEVDAIISDVDKNITNISIPKKDGTLRKIVAPGPALKYIQKRIHWRVLRKYKAHNSAHGFVANKGISTNAEPHIGANSVGKIDIEDFFGTINEDHIKNTLFGNKNICRKCKHYERMLDGGCHPSLYKNKEINFDYKCEEIKAVFIPNFCEETSYDSLFARIIKLCTYKGTTAQGFPTSPILANLVLRGFDKTMSSYCEEHGITYTRYADDLAFSSKTHSKHELRSIIEKKTNRQLWAYGFKPNKKKTNFKSKAGRLKVCGVVVNEKKNIQSNVVHDFRAKVHHATVKNPDQTTKSRLRQLKGFASYIMSVNEKKGKKYMDILTNFEKTKFKNKNG